MNKLACKSCGATYLDVDRCIVKGDPRNAAVDLRTECAESFVVSWCHGVGYSWMKGGTEVVLKDFLIQILWGWSKSFFCRILCSLWLPRELDGTNPLLFKIQVHVQCCSSIFCNQNRSLSLPETQCILRNRKSELPVLRTVLSTGWYGTVPTYLLKCCSVIRIGRRRREDSMYRRLYWTWERLCYDML